MRIIDIAGVHLIVSDSVYDYYWNQKNISEDSDAFKTACRRILGLNPDDHSLNISYVRTKIWGADGKDLDTCIDKILDSGLVEYNEKWCNHIEKPMLTGAAYTALKEAAVNPHDDEFEDELHL